MKQMVSYIKVTMCDNHNNQQSKHNLSCALLTCAEGLLDAGLETIISDTFKNLSKNNNYNNDDKGKYDDINYSISSISISNMCSMIILSQSSIILQSLLDLLDRYHITIKQQHHHNKMNREKRNNNNDKNDGRRYNVNDINVNDDHNHVDDVHFHVDDDGIDDDVYMNHTYEMLEDDDKKTSINMSKVSYGQYGRMLVTDQGIART